MNKDELSSVHEVHNNKEMTCEISAAKQEKKGIIKDEVKVTGEPACHIILVEERRKRQEQESKESGWSKGLK